MAAAALTPEELAGFETEARQLVLDSFGYTTNEAEVDRFHASRAPVKIVSCPARTSKSYAAWKDVLPDILLHGARVQFDPEVQTQVGWIVAPNYVLAKEFDYCWIDLVEKAGRAGFKFKISKKSNNATQGDMSIVIDWGRNLSGDVVKDIITVKSATNINVLQSEEVDWCILSEAARLPKEVWTKYLSTRVKRSIWPTTPDIEAFWIWEMIEKAANPELGIETFQFTGRANPTYNWNRYWTEHMKTEESEEGVIQTRPADLDSGPSEQNGHDCFDPLVQCAAMKENGFAEQFGGLWVFHKGRVVPIREKIDAKGRPAHVIDFDPEWIEFADLHVAFDYGYSDGTCIGFWFVTGSQIYLHDSIYETEMTHDDVADAVHEKVGKIAASANRDPLNLVTRYIGDPQQPAVAESLRRRGLPIFDIDAAAQRSRKAGNLELMNWLKTNPETGEPGMLIHCRNRDVIREWKSLRRKEDSKEGNPSSLVGADHAYDMARYFVMTRPVGGALRSHREGKGDFEKARRSILRQRREQRRVTVNYGQRKMGGLYR